MTLENRTPAALLNAWLTAQVPDCLSLLQSWVGVNSFTANRPGVLAHGHQVAEAFAPLGFRATSRDAANPSFGAHLALHGGSDDPTAPTLGLLTHLDTVFTPDEEAREGFTWSVEGDRAFGPGVNDIKGGTAMIWLVLNTLKTLQPTLFNATRWVILANAAEERLVPDFHPFCLEQLGTSPRACLVFEAGAVGHPSHAFPLVVSRKGRLEWSIAVQGRSAHAGADTRSGANAVVQAAHLIPRIASLTDPARALSVNVASLDGGSLANRVPSEARIHGECRAFEPAPLASVSTALRQLCELETSGVPVVRSLSDGHPCRARFEPGALHQPWPENLRTEALFTHWQEAAEQMGATVSRECRGGLSDGNALSALCPTLDGLGPTGGNSHCSQRSADGSAQPEFMLVSSLAPKALLNTLAIGNLLRP
jgi:glutamate carboxypeptidase